MNFELNWSKMNQMNSNKKKKQKRGYLKNAKKKKKKMNYGRTTWVWKSTLLTLKDMLSCNRHNLWLAQVKLSNNWFDNRLMMYFYDFRASLIMATRKYVKTAQMHHIFSVVRLSQVGHPSGGENWDENALHIFQQLITCRKYYFA